MIPITFNKDDLENEKKGTMRAQDLASLVGLLYPKKVGVLDIFDNPVVITNVDLSTTGYVKLSWSKGYVVAYGRLIYIEQGEIATFPLPASTESGNIGISINLAETGANEVEWFMRSGTLTQNNLLNEPANGVCEIALYNYTANNTTFNLETRVAQTIPNITDYLSGANFTTQPASDVSNKLATTEFVKNRVNSALSRIYTHHGSPHMNWVVNYIRIDNFYIAFGSVSLTGREGFVSLQDELAGKTLLSINVTVQNDGGRTFGECLAWYKKRDGDKIYFQADDNDFRVHYVMFLI